MTSPDCSECNKKPLAEHSALEAGICENQKFKRLLKKWSIVAMVAVAFATPIFYDASGEAQIQIFDETGNPVQLNNMPTQVLNLQQGQIYTGQVNEPTTVAGNVENLFVSVGNDGTTKFQFKIPSFQSELVVGVGQSAITLLIEPKAEDLIAGLNLSDLIGAGILVGIVAVALLIWRKRQN